MSDFIHLLSTGDPQLSFLACHNQKCVLTCSHHHQIHLQNFTNWEFQTIWKICSSNWIISPRVWGENNKYVSCHHLVHLFGLHNGPNTGIQPGIWFLGIEENLCLRRWCHVFVFFPGWKKGGRRPPPKKQGSASHSYTKHSHTQFDGKSWANPRKEMAFSALVIVEIFKQGRCFGQSKFTTTTWPSRKLIPSLTFLNGSSRTMFGFNEFITITSAKNN